MSLDDLKQRSDFDSCNLFYRFPHSPKPKKPSQDLPVPTPVDGSQSEDRDQEKRKKKSARDQNFDFFCRSVDELIDIRGVCPLGFCLILS